MLGRALTRLRRRWANGRFPSALNSSKATQPGEHTLVETTVQGRRRHSSSTPQRITWLAVAMSLTAVVLPRAFAEPSSSNLSRTSYVDAYCRFETAALAPNRVECGRLSVPENRNARNTRDLEIRVAVFRSVTGCVEARLSGEQ